MENIVNIHLCPCTHTFSSRIRCILHHTTNAFGQYSLWFVNKIHNLKIERHLCVCVPASKKESKCICMGIAMFIAICCKCSCFHIFSFQAIITCSKFQQPTLPLWTSGMLLPYYFTKCEVFIVFGTWVV